MKNFDEDARHELAGGLAGAASVAPLVTAVLDALTRGAAARGGPIPAGGPAAGFFAGEVLPVDGAGYGALADLTTALARGAADPADPRCAGHLHGPPLAVAVAAELAVAALNQSLDSWDQAPAATELEPRVVAALANLAGYGPGAAGVFTSGGTESNLMGLLLARDAAVPDASKQGLRGARVRILCSEIAHFSIQRSAALLGLGEDAVVAVPVDAEHRMDVAAASALMGDDVAAIVATAGTTDFGSIDPLPELADLAARHGAWLHVDAAYGGGALLSDTLAPLLAGIDRADSIALDLHKLGWQPVPAGVFLAARAASFDPLARQVAYLNPGDDTDAGYVSLLGRSLRTTRRADAFKVAVTFQALGRAGLGALVDACHDLARYAAEQIDAHADLELAARPVLTSVVFRYRPTTAEHDGVNAALRRRLLAEGTAVVGRTESGGRVWLKLTLLNPHATRADVDALLALVVAAGREEDG